MLIDADCWTRRFSSFDPQSFFLFLFGDRPTANLAFPPGWSTNLSPYICSSFITCKSSSIYIYTTGYYFCCNKLILNYSQIVYHLSFTINYKYALMNLYSEILIKSKQCCQVFYIKGVWSQGKIDTIIIINHVLFFSFK